MSPWEMKAHVAYVTEWTEKQPGLEEILRILDRFVMAWSGTWARYAVSDPGPPIYVNHLIEVRRQLSSLDGPDVRMKNEWPLLGSIEQFILTNAIAPAIIQRLQGGAARNQPFRMTA